MRTVQDVLTRTTAYFSEKGISNSRRQAEELLCDVLGVDRVKLYLNFERPLDEKELALCRERLMRRVRGEPLQYIHGEVEFFHCKIQVNPDVLIPRQETEILVDKIVKKLAKQELKGKQLWDVCCGSGCIGIALKKRFPDLTVVLSDYSAEALKVAKKNAEINQVDVEFLQGDLLSPFQGRMADFVVSNPPYISDSEYQTLDAEVKNYEPKAALVSGSTGLEFYERFAKELPGFLKPGASIFFEIGHRQGDAVKALFSGSPWKDANVEKDWSGHFRFFFLDRE